MEQSGVVRSMNDGDGDGDGDLLPYSGLDDYPPGSEQPFDDLSLDPSIYRPTPLERSHNPESQSEGVSYTMNIPPYSLAPHRAPENSFPSRLDAQPSVEHEGTSDGRADPDGVQTDTLNVLVDANGTGAIWSNSELEALFGTQPEFFDTEPGYWANI